MSPGFWSRRSRRVAEVDVEFEFELGLDESERHVVSVFELVDGMRSRITRPQELWDYGKAFERGGTRYRVAFKTIEILQALRSLNPQITPAGALVFDFLPPVLAFLRKRRDVRETEASSALKISDAPLQPLAIVDSRGSTYVLATRGTARTGCFVGASST